MTWLRNLRNSKYVLIVVAALIAAVSLIASNAIVGNLKVEEERRMLVWASAMSSLINAAQDEDVSLEEEILSSNKSIPVIIVDENDSIIAYNNIQESSLKKKAASILADGSRIEVPMWEDSKQYVCYSDSDTLVMLAYYPYIQLGVVVLFFIICFVAIISSKRAEQNRVWVGLSKETAHQLGTPISSLMAWVEVLRSKYPDDELLPEMGHDVEHLQVVAERFSKIGSKTESVVTDINGVVGKCVSYMKKRSPANVEYELQLPAEPMLAPVNAALIEWVLENLCKNAVDAMGSSGCITIEVLEQAERVIVDIADTGKGIAKGRWKSVFDPGYTTKLRGWGLGLSLAKRIVEEYHNGRIYVRKSIPGKGTTFRIELKK